MHQKSDDPDHKGIDAVMTKEEIAADLKKAEEAALEYFRERGTADFRCWWHAERWA